ncbi:hypothetical protein CROQUDRAFT_92514 [Cronartium quercuum f. sp. fusiforme G11]|uniref:Uncharacterized protein n=1 Tax=Cronartium quercuum f. sp. fusiforme G11 TaxID=708437 RepID=A0A9P6NIE0_9BASI|nr:hypothetical protein CROQUDRAFT_92514 [Cronartium quercuum f. sp. fusiforme G11]
MVHLSGLHSALWMLAEFLLAWPSLFFSLGGRDPITGIVKPIGGPTPKKMWGFL